MKNRKATFLDRKYTKWRIFIKCTTILFCLTVSVNAFAGETYFKFEIGSRDELTDLTRIISIDNVRDKTVYAYANDKELEKFRQLGIEFTILPHPGTLIQPRMSTDKAGVENWDSYPTYDAYVAMMNQFAVDYPTLCRIVDAGSTVQGRSILFARISDNADLEEDEPEVMLTSTIHGDETTGYVLMLRLIDSLLTSYGIDSLITRLVDSCEIWINPLANPDGTYNGGNNTVSGAIRYNNNSVDLNRNFPDPEDGDHPDGNSWQPETVIMMDLAEANNFVISANLHGGSEVVNYPWDTWSRRHADDQWFIEISRNYADSAQFYSVGGYLNDMNNGITNGYDWYEIAGGRQDYMNYWHSCREVTLEISTVKLVDPSFLPAYWDYNKVSFLNYLENGLYGIRGIVTDSVTGLPLEATVTVIGHDFDNSEIQTDPKVGDYHRMLEAGIYDLEFSAPDYIPKTFYNVVIINNHAAIINVELAKPGPYFPPDAPVLLFPDDGAVDISVPVLLDWDDAATSDQYNVQLDSNVLFTSSLIDTTLDPTQYEIISLEQNKKYYWRVRAENTLGWGDWSNIRQFTTALLWICGDADGSESINILDVTAIINYLYKGGSSPAPIEAADVNNSGSINILDVTAIINYLYKSGPELNCP